MSNMREINIEECKLVSGGEAPPGTVVTGGRPWWENLPGLVYSYASGTFSFAPNPTSFGSSGSGSTSMANWTLPAGWDMGTITNNLVDTDGDGTLDSLEIVVNGGQASEAAPFIDLGGGNWGLVGGLTFVADGAPGFYFGVGAPGAHVGTGVSTSGEAPAGWDSDTMTVVLRSGPIPIAGSVPAEPLPAREGFYYVDGWGPFGGAYYPIPGYVPPPVQPAD